MKILKINGGKTLNGTVKIGGAKNSVVAIIPASILCDENVTLYNVPDILDVENLEVILDHLNAKYRLKKDNGLYIETNNIYNKEITEDMSKKLRASYYFMGALLGKYKKAQVSIPGGCTIGERPIDQHLKGFEALGAKVEYDGNKIILTADELIGNTIYLDMPSVGATINIILAAVKAKGTTIIENAAREPEVVNVAMFLNSMGAKISGAGTNTIKIKGVDYLGKSVHEIIPDRIEAATYIMIGAAVCENLTVENIISEHLESLIKKLKEMGADITVEDDKIHITNKNRLKATKIRTQVYPGFVTDMQQVMASLMTQAVGTSLIHETIYENRFQNLYQLKKMGAKIKVEESKGYITGPTKLHSENVIATDLRAGAGLVLAALISDGETIINNVDYILRGYEHIVEKLTNIGAKIELIEI